MLKDSWVLVLQRRGQAKFIISNSRPYNQIKHKGSDSIFPDPPPPPVPIPSGGELPSAAAPLTQTPSLQIQLTFLRVEISILPTQE